MEPKALKQHGIEPCPSPADSGVPGYRRPPGWLRYPLIVVMFLSLYLGFGQSTFYKADGQLIVMKAAAGDPFYPTHVLLVPTLIGFAKVWHAVHLPDWCMFRLAAVLSALSGALAVLCIYRTARLVNLPGALAWMAAFMAGCAPAPFFFSTVVEFHAFHHAFAALALLLATILGRRPTWWMALALAAAMLLGYLSHASGVLLPVLCLPWAVATMTTDWRRVVRAGVLSLGLFFVLLLLSGVVTAQLGLATPSATSGYLQQFAHLSELWVRLRALPAVLLREFLVPYFPLYLLVPLAFFQKDCLCRRIHLALVPAFVAYLAMTTILLWADPESGAYLIPLAGPLAIAAAAACASLSRGAIGHALSAALFIAAAAAGMITIKRHDQPGVHRRWIGGLQLLAAEQPTLVVVGAKEELDALLLSGSKVPFLQVSIALLLPPAEAEARLRAELEPKARDGTQVLITRGSIDALQSWEQAPQARAFLHLIRDVWHGEQVERDGFVAVRLPRL